MIDKRFDDIIKNKMNSLEENSSASGDWERFEKELDALDKKDQIFDQQVSKKLTQITSAYYTQPRWENLYNLITRRVVRKKNVWRSKSLEFATMLLILFSMINLNQWNEKLNTPTDHKETLQYAAVESIKNSTEQTVISSIADSKKQTQSVASTSQSNVNQSSDFVLEEQSSTATSSQNLESVDEILSSNQNAFDTENVTIASGKISSSSLEPVTSAKKKERILYSDYQTKNTQETGTILPNSNMLVASSDDLLSMPNITPILNQKKWEWNIGAYISSSINEITFPEEKSFIYDTDQQFYVLSLNGGIMGDVQRNRWLLSAGIEYSKINYDLNLSAFEGDFFTNYTKTTLSNVEYNFISIPVDLGFVFLDRPKLEMFVTTGMSFDILSTTSYTLKIQQFDDEMNTLVTQNHKDLERHSTISNLNYQEGYFEGDVANSTSNQSTRKLFSSLYYKVRFGVGIKKNFNTRFAIFGKYLYQLQLNRDKGIGPNYDIINSSSMNLGIKYRLG